MCKKHSFSLIFFRRSSGRKLSFHGKRLLIIGNMKPKLRNFPKPIRPRKRRGVECVEVAVTLPLLLIAAFSTIQISHRWHVEKMLKIATYEAVKAGAASDGNADAAQTTFASYCNAFGINDARLVMNTGRFNSAETGQILSAQGRARTRSNRLPTPVAIAFGNWMSGGTVFHRKEGL